MQHLRTVTKDILKRVEITTGKSIQFMRDEELKLLATLQIARNGADFHVLRYRPSNEDLDYFVAFQAGFVLRLFENEQAKRFDFSPEPDLAQKIEPLLTTGQSLSKVDCDALPEFSAGVAQWALMNLRSLPIGMRIDQWIAIEYPELKELQASGIAVQQQQSMGVLSYKLGKLSVPTTLLGSLAAYALFADRLLGTRTYSIPFAATGLLNHGKELLRIWDELPKESNHDCELVDQWALGSGLTGWYKWVPYQP